MNDSSSLQSFGLWSLVIVNSLVFIIFAFSFAKREEADTLSQFSDEYRRYTAKVLAFIPRLGSTETASQR